MVLVALAACAGAGALEGVLATADEQVAVSAGRAFTWWEGGGGLVYVASGPDATCEDVVAFLQGGAELDPGPVLPGPDCNFLLTLYDWDGEARTFDQEDNWVLGWWNADCAMGEGSWEWKDNAEYSGYAWTGREWSGTASSFTTTVEPAGDGVEVQASLDAFDGNYIDAFGAVPAEGPVAGTVRAEPCAGLAEVPVFP